MPDEEEVQKLQDQIDDLKKETRETRKARTGIWLEVSEVQFEKGDDPLRVQLQGDRAHPKPGWWPVDKNALDQGGNHHRAYKAILREIDRKRLVLARLTCSNDKDHALHCDALRFQSAELGSR